MPFRSADKIKGKLVLDTREGIRKGGESGPAVVPGNLKASLPFRRSATLTRA